MLKKKTFTSKLIIIFVTTVLVPLVLLSLLSYYLSKRSLHEKTNDYLQNLASVIMSKVDDSVVGLEDISFYISGNSVIKKSLDEEQSADQDRISRYKNYESTKKILSYYTILRDEILSIYVQSDQGMVYSYSKTRKTIDFDKMLGDSELIESRWMVEGQGLFLVRRLNDYQVTIEVKPSVFYNIIKEIDYSGSGAVYLINDSKEIIAGKDLEAVGSEIPDEYLIVLKGQPGIYHNIGVGGQSCSVYVSDQISNGWRLVLAVPTSYYMSDILTLRNQTLIILTAAVLIAAGLIILLSRSITKPIKMLSRAMEEVGQGNLETTYTVDSEDEIGALSNTFNQMVEDMRTLINREYEQKVMKQSAEMKSLQMQINPHFLYNTLDTINWMARIQGIDDIGNMTSALGSLMRYSLSRKEFVTLSEELENLKNYVEIQNVRYGDKMTVLFDVAPGLMDYYIPKLLIQPILENAIVHGVEDKLEDSTITVTIGQEGAEELRIIVEDDGVGMTQEAIEKILSNSGREKRNHTSIGVNNVNRRIQMIFGREYGLIVQSELGAGTKITLRMKPLITPEDIKDIKNFNI